MVVVVALGVKDVQRLGLLYNENCWTVWKNLLCKSSIRVVSKVSFIVLLHLCFICAMCRRTGAVHWIMYSASCFIRLVFYNPAFTNHDTRGLFFPFDIALDAKI